MTSKQSHLQGLRALIWSLSLVSPLALLAQDEPTELEAFIAEETSAEDSDSLLPTDRTVSSAFFEDMTLLEIPRAITVLSPEAMEQFQIDDFGDLAKVGAGTERYNFYGIPGAPVIRGWQGGIYFNGMLRAFQRNEMPTSFGSLEAMEVVKGAAPAQFLPTHVGGYVNMIPKSPYFDEFRGSVKLEVGTYDLYNIQTDVGGPILIGDTPAAYRVSLTAQQAGSYYDRVDNDYISLYASVKARLSDNLRLFAGAEYYQFKSNENAGWNRPTQNLVSTGEYVIGEPLSLVRAGNGGFADRNIIDSVVFDFSSLTNGNVSDFRALVVPAAIIDAAVADGTITAAQRDLMKNMSDAQVRADTYAGLPDDIAQTTSGYLYTPDYFNAGGTVFTENIDGNQVLSDDRDFADSEDLMIFFDLDYTLESEAKIVNKVFIEAMETDKLSSYGYSFRSEQFIFDDRLSFINKAEINDVISINYEAGVQLRYSEATQLQDFFTEPFARRDITSANINPNTVILSGAQTDPLIDGRNYWAGGGFASGPGGAGVESELVQAATFLSAAVDFGEVFTVIGSARFEQADFEAVVPDGPPVDGPTTSNDGNLDYFNWSINPVIKLSPEASIYGVYQEATTYNPTQGGAILGESNFGEGELMEVGVKTALVEGKLYAGLAYYEWEQSSFNDREAVSNQFEAEGVELELTWQVTDSITVITSYGDREIVRVNPLGFRTMPWGLADPTGANNDEIGVALEAAGLLNQFSSAFGGFTPEGGSPGGRTELEVPGAPQTTFKGFVAVDLPSGFSVSGGFVWQDEYWHNYDQTILIDAATIWNLNVGYETGNWSALLSIENLFDEEYFLGAEPEFGANTLITKAPGTEARLTLTYTF